METLPPQNTSPAEKLQNEELFNAHEAVEWVGEQGVELKNPEQLALHVEALVSEFVIEPEALQQGRSKLLLAAIANELGDTPFGENQATSSKVADMVALAFGSKTRFKDAFAEHTHGAEHMQGRGGDSAHGERERSLEARTNEAYEALTNREVSADLESYMQTSEAFMQVRQRLGITDETETPFTVRVLDIGNDQTMYGWQPTVDWANMPSDEALAQQEAQTAQAQRLRDNEKYLIAESGADAEHGLAPAWVNTDTEGNVALCVPLPIAEKLLYRDAPRASHYDAERGFAEDQAILLHEFTHTQKQVTRGDHIGLGIALEELRAEHFSGDQHGYTEIKKYFASMQVLFGYSPKNAFEKDTSFNSDDFELDIAQNIGLEGYLDAMTLIPPTYAEDPSASVFVQELARTDGGIDGHFNAMHARAVAEFGEAEIAQRTSAFVDRVVAAHAGLGDTVLGVEDLLTYKYPRAFARVAMADYAARYARG